MEGTFWGPTLDNLTHLHILPATRHPQEQCREEELERERGVRVLGEDEDMGG